MDDYDFCNCGFTERTFVAQVTAAYRWRSEMNVTSRTAQLGQGIYEFGDTGIVAINLDCST